MLLYKKRWPWLGISIVAALAAIVGPLWLLLSDRSAQDSNSAPPLTFDGASDRLQQTVIVPTLDAPIPDGKSAVWCVSFQLAWNRLKTDVAGEPLQLANAQALADRLNRADHAEDSMAPDAVYAAAGLAKDGIVQRIQEQMANKFPQVPPPEIADLHGGAVAYAYLAAAARYDIPYFENDEPFFFTDATGKQTAIGAFGIRKKDEYAYDRLRQQAQVLYCPQDARMSEREIPEFILDPCKTSRPYQIVLARMSRKATLADTLAAVEQKLAAQPAPDTFLSRLHPRDTLLVPNIAWRISHRFKELEGSDKQFANSRLRGLFLDTALQTIHFRLDRSGAELASESRIRVKPGASFFHFNRPFLVYMKKRDGKQPFFVMWVENAELLEKKVSLTQLRHSPKTALFRTSLQALIWGVAQGGHRPPTAPGDCGGRCPPYATAVYQNHGIGRPLLLDALRIRSMSLPAPHGIARHGLSADFAADEVQKSNLILEGQLLLTQHQLDAAAYRFAQAAALRESWLPGEPVTKAALRYRVAANRNC